MKEEQKRRRTRVPVQFEVMIRIADEPLRMETLNISLNGMLCAPDKRLAKGNRGEVRILLSPEAVIEAKAEVVRSDEKGIAVAFTEVSAEGFGHLKRLVQYNTEDPDLIDRELASAGFARDSR